MWEQGAADSHRLSEALDCNQWLFPVTWINSSSGSVSEWRRLMINELLGNLNRDPAELS